MMNTGTEEDPSQTKFHALHMLSDLPLVVGGRYPRV